MRYLFALLIALLMLVQSDRAEAQAGGFGLHNQPFAMLLTDCDDVAMPYASVTIVIRNATGGFFSTAAHQTDENGELEISPYLQCCWFMDVKVVPNGGGTEWVAHFKHTCAGCVLDSITGAWALIDIPASPECVTEPNGADSWHLRYNP